MRSLWKPGLVRAAERYRIHLEATKAGIPRDGFDWYPYDSFTNFYPIGELLEGTSFEKLALEDRVLDVGCADGSIAFFLESLGCSVDAVDHPSTNYNAMRGLRALHSSLRSKVEIHELDLDDHFTLPRESYGLVLFLGVLYHLKNPFYALERLRSATRFCLLSARIAGWTPDCQVEFANRPMAYLLDDRETNADPTNYWIFSRAALDLLLRRSGWEVLKMITTGETRHSDPVRPDRDERAFCLLKGSG